MYTTPATGSNQNPNDLEDYLLGKKRVDKILTADENEKARPVLSFRVFLPLTCVQLGASHKSFIAVQNANTVQDIASKIREDPLLAMKQQEQAAYQALMSNPLRLRDLQERNGIKPKKNKGKEKKREKKGKEKSKNTEHRIRGRSPSRSVSPMDDRRRSPSRSYEHYDRDYARRSPSPHAHRPRSPIRSHRDSRRNEYSSRRSRSRSPELHHKRWDDRARTWPHSDESDDMRRNYSRGGGRGGRYADDSRKRRRSPSPVNDTAKRSRMTPPPQSRSHPADSTSKPTNNTEDRAARLAAMQSNASTMEVDRQKRLLELLAKEKAELEAENEVRSKSKGMGGFLSQEQKKVFGGEGGLEDRIRRGRGGLVVDAD